MNKPICLCCREAFYGEGDYCPECLADVARMEYEMTSAYARFRFEARQDFERWQIEQEAEAEALRP